jgi:hypothetical protein
MSNFVDEVKRLLGVKEIDSKTMIYRFNGFISSCNLDLTNAMWNIKARDTNNPYISTQYEDKENSYDINISNGYESGKGKVLILLGKYNDLSMLLVNYIDKDYNKNKVNELPFHIKLKKPKDNYIYLMEIVCDSNTSCIFKITRTIDDNKNILNFDGNIKFDNILKIVESFTKDPEYLFNKYNDVIENKRFHFTDEELSSGMINIDKEPVKKKKKH